jgi:hypothetical protein
MEDPRLAQLPSQIDSAKCLVLEVGLPNCSSAHKHKSLLKNSVPTRVFLFDGKNRCANPHSGGVRR